MSLCFGDRCVTSDLIRSAMRCHSNSLHIKEGLMGKASPLLHVDRDRAPDIQIQNYPLNSSQPEGLMLSSLLSGKLSVSLDL